MINILSKIGGYLLIYLVDYLVKVIAAFVEKEKKSSEDKKNIKEAFALEDRKEAARRLNEILKRK